MEVQAISGGFERPLPGPAAARPAPAKPLPRPSSACVDKLLLDNHCRTKDLFCPAPKAVAFARYLEQLNRENRIEPSPDEPLPFFAEYLAGVNRAARLAEPIGPSTDRTRPAGDGPPARTPPASPTVPTPDAAPRSPLGSPRLGDVAAPETPAPRPQPAPRPPLTPILTGRVLDVFA